MLVDSLKEHEGILMLTEKLKNDLGEMDEVLKTADSEKLPDKKRDRILDRKELYWWFISFFQDTQEEMDSLEKQIEIEEKHLIENKDNFIV